MRGILAMQQLARDSTNLYSWVNWAVMESPNFETVAFEVAHAIASSAFYHWATIVNKLSSRLKLLALQSRLNKK